MNRILYTLAIATLALSAFGRATAQKRFSERMYGAYIEGDAAGWSEVIRTLEREPSPDRADSMELLEYYYGHTAYLINCGERKEARKYIARADGLLDGLLTSDPGCAEALSIKGVFLGYKMRLSGIKAPVLGPRCIKLIKKAYAAAPESPQVLADMGHMLYHCPAVFGGSRKKGMEYLEEAAGRLESEGLARNNWFYVNLLSVLAQYREETGSPELAEMLYRKIMRAEPRFVRPAERLVPPLREP